MTIVIHGKEGRRRKSPSSEGRQRQDNPVLALDNVERDWSTYQRHAVEFHISNAEAWAGQDLITQIDPDFTLRPDLEFGRPTGLTPH